MKKTILKRMWILTLVLAVVTSASVAMAQDVKPKDKGGFESAEKTIKSAAPADKNGKAVADKDGKKAEGEEGKEVETKKPGLFDSSNMIFIMIALIAVMFIFSSRGRKKQARKRQEVLESISKGSKIVTIGGIVGTVVEVRDDEILVSVDDGTRMKFARWAIRTVGDEANADKKDNSQQQR